MTDKYRNWCFTVNNYTDNDVNAMESVASTARYLVYGKEVSESGTPHLQGFVMFPNQRKATALHKLFPSPTHWTVARDLVASATYCRKDGDYKEFGICPSDTRKKQGKRSDLLELRDAINEGQRDTKRLRQDFPDVCAKYPNFVAQLILDQVPAPQLFSHPLRPWQSELSETLNGPTNDRDVIFVVDESGNNGKTWFTRYYASLHDGTSTILPGKKSDMTYAFLQVLRDNTRVVFVDCPRSKSDMFQYDFLEDLKNGRMMNTKYESRMFEFTVPHVVVFMNQEPDMEKLSEDRYFIIRI